MPTLASKGIREKGGGATIGAPAMLPYVPGSSYVPPS